MRPMMLYHYALKLMLVPLLFAGCVMPVENEQERGVIHVQVLDRQSQPIVGATVQFDPIQTAAGRIDAFGPTTNKAGIAVSPELPAGSYAVTVRSTDVQTQRAQVVAQQVITVTVVLKQ